MRFGSQPTVLRLIQEGIDFELIIRQISSFSLSIPCLGVEANLFVF